MKFYRKSSQGFTLIELLVVVAIVGILATILVGVLGGGRNKAADNAIKQQLAILRTEAEIIFSATGSYDTVCSPSSNSGIIYRAAFAQGQKDDDNNQCNDSSTTSYISAGGVLTTVAKTSSPDKWGAVVHLKNGNYFCVDYTGYGKETPVRLLGGGNWTSCQ